MDLELQKLRKQLLQFRYAKQLGRKALVKSVVVEIQKLPLDIKNYEEASFVFMKMSFAATFINYAFALHRIENQEYFDILPDFSMTRIFTKKRFTLLKDYFVFHKLNPQMKLKKALTEYSNEIWQLFRQAQKNHLDSEGIADKFHLDELDILNPPSDQLYPLQIQMMSHYENEAVDRVSANRAGEYRFAERNGFYLLPGGGMVEGDFQNKEHLIQKMLDEHLEEEHANLWQKAARLYNEIDPDLFIERLKESISKSSYPDNEFKRVLNDTITKDISNSLVLAEMIDLVSLHEKESDHLQSLNQFKAAMQVETFKLTPLYDEAIDFIKTNTSIMKIEQFGDTRVCGGKQISNSFLMTGEPLEIWFSHHFPNFDCEFGDDIRGSTSVRFTLLQALVQFTKIKYSHLLIVLAHQLQCFEQNTLNFEEIWQPAEYNNARAVLISEAAIVLNMN